jgi:hypothetical protein
MREDTREVVRGCIETAIELLQAEMKDIHPAKASNYATMAHAVNDKLHVGMLLSLLREAKSLT